MYSVVQVPLSRVIDAATADAFTLPGLRCVIPAAHAPAAAAIAAHSCIPADRRGGAGPDIHVHHFGHERDSGEEGRHVSLAESPSPH